MMPQSVIEHFPDRGTHHAPEQCTPLAMLAGYSFQPDKDPEARQILDGVTAMALFALDVDRVVGYRLRGNFLEPVRRFCGNRNDVAFAQMVGRSAFG